MVTPGQLPHGGLALWNMRMKGEKPDLPVIVSLIGPRSYGNPQVWIGDAIPDLKIASLEFRFLHTLDVQLHVDTTVPIARVLKAVLACEKHCAGLSCHFVDQQIIVPIRFDKCPMFQWATGGTIAPSVERFDTTVPLERPQLEFAVRVDRYLRQHLLA